MTRVAFTVHDDPTGKGRPKFVRATGRTYTPKATANAEAHVRAAWLAAGALAIEPGVPLAALVHCHIVRPRGHYKVDGTLSAAGRRSPRPTKRPDVDNIAKLILDALEGYAYPHDAAIVDLTIRKWWGEPARSVVTIEAAAA